MQPLPDASIPSQTSCSTASAADALMDVVPPVLWFIRRQMRAHRTDLSLPQFRVLSCVNHEPDASLSTVADFLGASLPTASRIVSGLVKKRLLQRAESTDDRRQMSLRLTDEGRCLMKQALRGTASEMAKEIAHLSGEQKRLVLEAMTTLREVFGSSGFLLAAKRERASAHALPASAPGVRE